MVQRPAHWLASALDGAGVPGAHDLVVPDGTPATVAWRQAERVLGVSEEEIARHVATRFRLRLADLGRAAPTTARLLPESLVRSHAVFPLRDDDVEIVVATVDPTDAAAEAAIASAAGRQVAFEIAPPGALHREIARRWSPGAAVGSFLRHIDGGADGGSGAARLVELVLNAALEEGATAIELGPPGDAAGVHIRRNGSWTRLMTLPVPVLREFAAELGAPGRTTVLPDGRDRVLHAFPAPGGAPDSLRIRIDAKDDGPGPVPGAFRVMIVDDDPLIRLLGRTVLEADGLDVLEAEDGAEAAEAITSATDVRLVVLDLDMPRMDGHVLLARLRADVRTAGLPVVVLTASNNPADEARTLERGADDYIRKPIDPPRLQARVRATLRRLDG